jgi:hypothetical protein
VFFFLLERGFWRSRQMAGSDDVAPESLETVIVENVAGEVKAWLAARN